MDINSSTGPQQIPCPRCSRSFPIEELQLHMGTTHPAAGGVDDNDDDSSSSKVEKESQSAVFVISSSDGDPNDVLNNIPVEGEHEDNNNNNNNHLSIKTLVVEDDDAAGKELEDAEKLSIGLAYESELHDAEPQSKKVKETILGDDEDIARSSEVEVIEKSDNSNIAIEVSEQPVFRKPAGINHIQGALQQIHQISKEAGVVHLPKPAEQKPKETIKVSDQEKKLSSFKDLAQKRKQAPQEIEIIDLEEEEEKKAKRKEREQERERQRKREKEKEARTKSPSPSKKKVSSQKKKQRNID